MKFLLIIILTVFYGCTKYKAQPIFPPNKDYMPPPSAPKPSPLNDPVHIEEWNSKGAMGRRKQEISTLRWKLENPNLNKNQADKLWQKLADEIGFCPSVK